MIDHTTTRPAREVQQKSTPTPRNRARSGKAAEPRGALPTLSASAKPPRKLQRSNAAASPGVQIGTIIVAGAWPYALRITTEGIAPGQLGMFDSRTSEILLHPDQTAAAALGTVAHEFCHAWVYHVDHARKEVTDLIKTLNRATGGSGDALAYHLAEREVECMATMLGCWYRECVRLDLPALLARHVR